MVQGTEPGAPSWLCHSVTTIGPEQSPGLSARLSFPARETEVVMPAWLTWGGERMPSSESVRLTPGLCLGPAAWAPGA